MPSFEPLVPCPCILSKHLISGPNDETLLSAKLDPFMIVFFSRLFTQTLASDTCWWLHC